MRLAAAAVIAAALLGPAAASAQDAGPPDAKPLDSGPMIWRGAKMGPEQVYEGDFTIDYQTSVLKLEGETVWLSGWQDRPGDNGGFTRRYHVRLVGRHTLEPGKYGGLGAYPHTILMTRLISARVLIGASDGASLRP